ncbi:DNA polymerase III subunit delta' [Caldibacillus lycopersici]|uniref:DNA polymerase III subunit delta' n=1 Tax=Perspicuibacillus lycopersici TaxID=1325689 RepID=A0AAE3IVF3_9BACI|nr:DNA polymerase III subunit delta' [Perspicuibacillus lycopersici]MCU9615308.1 DNA polymerase III subunit delta' [Perspicuibacillus lycopersici]
MENTWNELYNLQPTVMKLIKNALIKDRIAHAYLFEGMRGTGKKEIGLYFAKALFCLNLKDGFQPCEQCIHCQRINHGNHPDLHIVEPDGASIKKEQIHLLQQEFSKKGMESSQKFYMLIGADQMTTNAANSLLKFLEEPNQKTTAILITENIQKILPTIYSRCQHVSFKPLSKNEMIRLLVNKGVKPEKAPLYAHLTNNVEEALEMKEDEWFLQAQKIVLKLYEILSKNQLMDALLFLHSDWLSHFKERSQIDTGLDMLLYIYKDLLYIQLDSDDMLVYPDQKNDWQKNALQVSKEKLANQILAILETKKRLQSNVNGPLLMEQLLIKLQEGSNFV